MLAPKELHVAERSMRTTVLMGVTVNWWPHTSTELSVPCGSPTTCQGHFTLLFSHTSSSFWNFKHLLSSSHATDFVLYIPGKIGAIRKESPYISFAKLNYLPSSVSSSSATLPVTDLSFLLPIANSPLVQQPPTTSHLRKSFALIVLPSLLDHSHKYTISYNYPLTKIVFTWPSARCPLPFLCSGL